TLNPIYNECFEFDLSKEEFQYAHRIFKVIDYNRVGSNELIDCIGIGIGIHFDGINRDYWYQMLEYTRIPITKSFNLHETIPIITCTNQNKTK
ncbi:unnamed protein product, partial [Rotaria sp. Silwood1]